MKTSREQGDMTKHRRIVLAIFALCVYETHLPAALSQSLVSPTNLRVVTLDNAPPSNVSITSPTPGTILSSCLHVALSATATDDSGVANVEFFDNGILIAGDLTAPYTAVWDVCDPAMNGLHTLTAIASDDGGNTTTSPGVNVTVNLESTPPTDPTNFIATALSCYQVRLTWTASTDSGGSGLGGYWLGIAAGGGVSTQLPATVASYTDSLATPSTDMQYYLYAYDNAGNISNQILASITTPACTDTTPPAVPTVTATALNCSAVRLSWPAVSDGAGGSGLRGYRIYRNGMFLKQLYSPSTTFDDTGLKSSTNFQYQVSSFDNSFNESALSTARAVATTSCTSIDGQLLTQRQFHDNSGFSRSAIYDTDFDSSGNLYMTGDYAGVINFGGTPISADPTNTLGSRDIFVTKLSSAGTQLWARSIGGADNDFSGNIVVDGSGNSFVSGSFSGTINFGTAAALTSSGTYSAFLASYDPSGNFRWAKLISGTEDSWNAVNGLATDGSGNVIYAGSFTGRVDLGNGQLQSSNGGSDIFIAKYSGANGSLLWSRTAGAGEDDEAAGVATSSTGEIALTGTFTNAINVGGRRLSKSSAWSAIFVAKYANDGTHLWSRAYGDYTDNTAYAISFDPSANVIFSASSGDRDVGIDFGAGPQRSAGYQDLFLVKLTSAGNLVWSKQFGLADSINYPRSIAVDSLGNIALAGEFHGSIDFGSGALQSAEFFGPTASYTYDIFLTKFSPSGTHLWSHRYGDIGFGEAGYGLAFDNQRNVILAGYFGPQIDFGETPFTAVDQNDAFLAKFAGVTQ